MGEREQKEDSEESQENNSLKILMRNIYIKPVLESEKMKCEKNYYIQFSSKLQV